MVKHIQAKRHEFTEKQRKLIYERDNGQCIFCSIRYHVENASWFDVQIDGVMHYISRRKGGLGIEQNGALGCRLHHRMLDHGSSTQREEMLDIFRRYLQSHYKDWDEKKLIYNKWSCFEES